MNSRTTGVKDYLHKLIAETDDIDVLTKVQAYFSSLSHKNIDWWDYLDDDEKKNIQTGINQLNNGNGISNDDVKLKVDKLIGRT